MLPVLVRKGKMPLWVWVVLFCFVSLFSVLSGHAQQTPLQRRPEAVVVPSVPPPMRPPATLETARLANGDMNYRALRDRRPNGEAFSVSNLVLRRDAGVFTLINGTIYLYGPVAGRTTGAVFLGEGTLHVEPPSEMERRQLKAVMKTEVLDEHFSSAVFAFTDETAAELKRSAIKPAAGAGAAEGRAEDSQKLFRQELKYNLEARLLEDLSLNSDNPAISAGGATAGFFLAEMKSGVFSKRLIFVLDPNGAFGVAPEEVALLTSSSFGYDVTLGFHSETALAEAKGAEREMAQAGGGSLANTSFKITQQTLDVTLEKSGKLVGTAVTAITANQQLQVLPLDLAPSLRVSGVWGPNGEALDFIQEDKLKDASFAVVLSKPLAGGQSLQITTRYAGKDAVIDEGNNNYYLVARENWYPNRRGELGNYAFYDMTFHTARALEVVATGNKISDHTENGQRTSVWQTASPIPVAGFNLGEFKTNQSERNKTVQVVSYANTDLADRYRGLTESGMPVGTMSTTGMLKVATSEGDAAVQIYTDFFGALPYDHIFLTQQTACNYGQSWPMLVYLPICYFWDATIQHQLGLDRDPTYWKVVTAHEVAHQWWGQTVGFDSYRDQWMSEGFANFSASLFLMQTRPNMKEYREFWALMRKRLLERNAEGLRPVDVGPVVMGTRVNSSKTGDDVYQQLVYDKGAYILHSLEMLFWSDKYGEAPFKQAMHDFVTSYRNRPATTEEFKAVMERNMTPWMNADGNHRLDWFFNAYVYGSATPHYTISSEFTKKEDEITVHFKVSQSNVPADFKMLVPVYLETADQRTAFLGRVLIVGDSSVEKTANLGKIPMPAKPLLLNYNFDLLSE